MTKQLYITRHSTSLGEILIGTLDGKLVMCEWNDEKKLQKEIEDLKKLSGADIVYGENEDTKKYELLSDQYLNRQLKDVNVLLQTFGTDFQKKVWEELTRVPYGETASYKQIAERIGLPNHCRAVANACGQNRICIFIPCHRITASHGIGGYSGKLWRKERLLEIEGK